jgi:hypothetical protein
MSLSFESGARRTWQRPSPGTERLQAGLGERFVAAVEEVFFKVKKKPGWGVIVYKTLRARVRRFPYGVFYQVVGAYIVVVGVVHNRRAPRRWKSRLE